MGPVDIKTKGCDGSVADESSWWVNHCFYVKLPVVEAISLDSFIPINIVSMCIQ